MTQVAGIQAVNAEGKVIGTLSVDYLTELVATKIVREAKNEAVSARSASVMSEASTIAATDEYEDQLELDTNPAYVRSLDSEGNPKRTATTSLATVVGGLIGTATLSKNGLMGTEHVRMVGIQITITGSGKKGKYIKLFSLTAYNGTLASVEWCSYGSSEQSFHVELLLGSGAESTIPVRTGRLISGRLGSFKFYIVGPSIYMFIPNSVYDAHLFISSRMGRIHDGTDISDSIDTSTEISIS